MIKLPFVANMDKDKDVKDDDQTVVFPRSSPWIMMKMKEDDQTVVCPQVQSMDNDEDERR